MARRALAVASTLGITAVALVVPMLLRKRSAVATISGTTAITEVSSDTAFYKQQKLPDWAPPQWAFPVAWTLNTVALAAAAQHLAFRQNHPRRGELLGYLALHTAIYASFQRVYFDERSPILGAIWTAADFAVCHVAFYQALSVNRRLAMAFVPVNLWLTVALPLSLHQAAANHDAIYGALGVEAGEIIAATLGVSPIRAAKPAFASRALHK